MGMFDDIEVLYPLPRLPDGHDRQFQTKSLMNELLSYRIDADGLLWREDFDVEDHSDPTATGVMRFAGIATRVNKRWVRDTYTGEVEFYDFDEGVWSEYQAWFREGVLRDLVVGADHEPFRPVLDDEAKDPATPPESR
jgi:hypothetical protein